MQKLVTRSARVSYVLFVSFFWCPTRPVYMSFMEGVVCFGVLHGLSIWASWRVSFVLVSYTTCLYDLHGGCLMFYLCRLFWCPTRPVYMSFMEGVLCFICVVFLVSYTACLYELHGGCRLFWCPTRPVYMSFMEGVVCFGVLHDLSIWPSWRVSYVLFVSFVLVSYTACLYELHGGCRFFGALHGLSIWASWRVSYVLFVSFVLVSYTACLYELHGGCVMFYLCRLFWCPTRPVYMTFMEGVLCFICVVCFGVLHDLSIWPSWRVSYVLFVSFVLVSYTACLYELHAGCVMFYLCRLFWCPTRPVYMTFMEGVLCFICVVCFGVLHDLSIWASWRVSFVLVSYTTCLYELHGGCLMFYLCRLFWCPTRPVYMTFMEGVLCFICVVCFGVLHDLSICLYELYSWRVSYVLFVSFVLVYYTACLYERHGGCLMFYLCRLFWCTTRPVYMSVMEGVLCFICVVCFGVLHDLSIWASWRVSYVLFVSFVLVSYTTCLYERHGGCLMFYLCRLFWCPTRPVYMTFMEGVLCFICVVCFGVLHDLSIWASWRVSYVLFVSFVLVYYTTCLYELHGGCRLFWCPTRPVYMSFMEGVLCFICVVCFGVLHDLSIWASWRVSYVLFVSFVLVSYTTCLYDLHGGCLMFYLCRLFWCPTRPVYMTVMEAVDCFGVLHDLSIWASWRVSYVLFVSFVLVSYTTCLYELHGGCLMFYLCRLFWCPTRPVYMSFMEGVLCFICVVCFGVLHDLSIWASWRVSYVLFVSFVLVSYTTCLYELHGGCLMFYLCRLFWCPTRPVYMSVMEGVLCFICVVCFGVLHDLSIWASWRVSYVLFVSFVLVSYTTCLYELHGGCLMFYLCRLFWCTTRPVYMSFMEGVVCFGVLHDLSIWASWRVSYVLFVSFVLVSYTTCLYELHGGCLMFYLCRLFWCPTRPVYMSFMEGVLCFICVVCFGVLHDLSIWASWRVSYVLFVSFVLVYYTTCLYELHGGCRLFWCPTRPVYMSFMEGVLCFICVVCFGVLHDLSIWPSWRVSYVLFVSFVLVSYTTCLYELHGGCVMFYLCRLFWCPTRPVYMSFMEGVLCFICVVCFGVLHDLSIWASWRVSYVLFVSFVLVY